MTGPEQHAATVEGLAQAFHEAYERLAPTFGYSTRRESAVPWEDVPAENRSLMIAVVGEVVAPELVALARERNGGTLVQRWRERAEAAEARTDDLQRKYDDIRGEYLVLEERADELQREREELRRANNSLGNEVEQARREADQLRAALLAVVDEWTITGRISNTNLLSARAALAGVQADKDAP